jgi:hypothetical protein
MGLEMHDVCGIGLRPIGTTISKVSKKPARGEAGLHSSAQREVDIAAECPNLIVSCDG